MSYSRCPAALARKLEAGVLWPAHVTPKRGARGRTEGRDVEAKRDEREAGSGDLALKRGWMGSESLGDARRLGRGSWGRRNEKGAWPEEARIAVSCSLASKEQFPRGGLFSTVRATARELGRGPQCTGWGSKVNILR